MDYTTVDDMASSGGDGSMWTTVDGTPMLRAGWQPGKKHSIGQNILRVVSFGGYNPDDRDASAINKKILQQHGMNQEQRDMLEKQQMAEMIQDAHTYQRAHPDVTFEAAMMEVANNRAAQMLAKTAEFEAAQSLAGLNKTESDAAKPGASDVVRSSQQATISSNEANIPRNIGLKKLHEASNTIGLPGKIAVNNSTAEDLREQQMRRDNTRGLDEAALDPERNILERQKLANEQALMHEADLLRSTTADARMRAAQQGANVTAAQAAAAARTLSNPTTADEIYRAGVNRANMVAAPADTTVFTPLPVGGSVLHGASRSGNMSDYKTVTTTEIDANGNPIVTRQRVATPRTPEVPGTITPGAPIQKIDPAEILKFRPR